MTDLVHPEDPGINSNLDRDWADAAVVAQMGYDIEEDLVLTGLEFTVNFTTPDFDLSSGAFRTTTSSQNTNDHSAQTPSVPQESLQKVPFTCDMDARTGVSLTDNDVNFVYADIDLTSQDSVSVVVNTTGSAPSSPSIKLGQIDTSNNTSRETNRGPYASGSIDYSSTPLVITHGFNRQNISDATFYDDVGDPVIIDWSPKNADQIDVDSNLSVTGSYELRK